ncbi:PLP-dependent aminotransferase family protein [Psychrobacter sp. LV10R520-6]|uniref:aminotransferase-like domain-containing protein n=1 Tax=Psychrobacter sp. LV10R520-6 TaxID=1415574 RepID=UPI0024C57ADB|nr:PLP-dependent aminotransferase family protein [Psychrobacter sp. LV10R520-6]SNT70038.1 transcriptional regulator, GntR family [Psychrobacter sp. LV10R520-6]
MNDTHSLNLNISKTAAVVEWIQQRIDSQIYKPYQRVPSVRKLATILDVSSFTITQAYEQLVATNVLTAKPNSGYYVLPQVTQSRNLEILYKEPVVDTSWLVQQMFSDVPNHRAPGSGELPVEWIKNDRMQWAVRQVNQDIDSFIYNYGDIQGYLPLRDQLTQYLDLLGIHTSVDNIITTTGVSQAILTVIQLLLNVGDTVIVDSPGWYWTSSTLQQQGYHVVSVARDHQGSNIEQMQQVLEKYRAKLYITNSVLHNPTSYNLHPARAHQVLNLMHEYDAYIFEDDLYAAFLPDEKPLRYANIDQFERVFYATGFSKSMASGWRVGMLVSPDRFINQILNLKTLSNMTSPEFGERVIHRLWTHGEYRRQIKKVQQQLYTAHERLRKALPKIGLIYPEHTQAGIFIWVDTGQDTGNLALDAYKENWLVAPGQLFHPDANVSTYLRLNVSTTSDEFLKWLGVYLNQVNNYL